MIVEDNPILAYDLETLVSDAGAGAVGPALDLSTGLQLARENQLDAALLDIDLGSERVWPLARELVQHNVPFSFISARCRQEDLPEDFQGSVCLEKPARSSDILVTLDQLTAAHPTA